MDNHQQGRMGQTLGVVDLAAEMREGLDFGFGEQLRGAQLVEHETRGVIRIGIRLAIGCPGVGSGTILQEDGALRRADDFSPVSWLAFRVEEPQLGAQVHSG